MRVCAEDQLYARTQPWMIFFIAVYVSAAAPEPRWSAGGAIVGFHANFCDGTGPIN